MFKNAA
ncbi:hypothetical protein VCEDC020_003336A, partial [Vibrio cholerae O1 str. EDC-020]